MTVSNVTATDVIDPAWGNAVADQLNRLPPFIQSGELNGTSDSNGDLELTFPSAFAAAPVVTATRRTSTDAPRGVHIASVTATTARFTVTGTTATQADTAGIYINWIAIGSPA